jgi:glycosyltransferase involved in cell wall biosynthesis
MCDNSVSVIIPAYNVESCLGRCLYSALSQELSPAQAIIVNDGSTDRTAEVAKSYGDRIVYIEQENKGPAAARNAGLRVATGEFVAFLDADDYWLPGFLRETTAFLFAHPEAVAVSTGYVVKRFEKQHVGPKGLIANSEADNGGYVLRNFFDTWAQHDHVIAGTVLIRRDIIEETGPQLEIRISEDLEYWGYLATFGPWGFIPEPLWVGDSYAQAAKAGWLKHYRRRWRECPSIEEWQHRIVPRLKEADWTGFRTVRGRVAAGFAHSMILAGNRAAARSVVSKYGKEMGDTPFAMLIRLADRVGWCGWGVVCCIVRAREFAKASRIALSARRLGS